MNDPVLDNLKKLVKEYYKVLSDLQSKIQTMEDVPKAKALVGKCFKYQNGYSHHDKWWMYMGVVASQDAYIFIDQFEENNEGKIEFYHDRETYLNLANNWIQITEDDYNKNRQKVLKHLIEQDKKRSK